MESLHSAVKYIGKRTPNGLVLKRLKGSVCEAVFFVPVDKRGNLGEVKEMHNGNFLSVTDEVASTVLHFARKHPDL